MGAVVVDTRGLRCPLPLLKIRKSVRGAPSQTKFEILTTDPGAVEDIKDFCETSGWKLVSAKNAHGYLRTIIRKS